MKRWSGLAVAAFLSALSTTQSAWAQAENAALRGIVRAADEAWISTDIDARIATLPFREGETFKAGDILATLDCGDLSAQLTSAEALQRSQALTLANNQRLEKLNAAGRLEVALSQAKADQAEGEAATIRSKLSRCSITAPFDGRVALMRAHAHEFPDRSSPLMQIVGVGALEVDVLLPSQWLKWLAPGQRFRIAIDETGADAAVVISRIAAVVDPVSQTVKVTGRFADRVPDILPGMSGPTIFAVPGDG